MYMGGNSKLYTGSLESRSVLPPSLPLWVKLGSKICKFCFRLSSPLLLLEFLNVFEVIGNHIQGVEKIGQITSGTPLMGKTWDIKSQI